MAWVTKNKTLVYFILLALLVGALRLPSLPLILDTDSSANAFFARQMLRGETLYDTFHPAHHLPGIYHTFLLSFQLFGDNPLAPRLLLIGFIIVNTWLVFLMGRDFFDQRAGLLGAVFYALISSQMALSGTTVEMEHFANLPLTAVVFLFLILVKRNVPAITFAWVGVLAAVCVLYKVTFVGSLAAVGCSLFIGAWLDKGQHGNVKKLLARFGAISVGALLPLVLVGAYFAGLGLWPRFLLLFTLGVNYFNDPIMMVTMGSLLFPRPFGFPLFMIAINNFALLFFGLMGTYRLTRLAISLPPAQKLVNLTLVLWLVISLALAGMRGGGFAHYPLIACPPLALIAGIEISWVYARWKATASRKQALAGAGVMVALVVGVYFWSNLDLYRPYLSTLPGLVSSQETYDQRYQKRQRQLIDYIAVHTTSEDFIYVWSSHLQEYYYADRLPPIDILWPEYVSATGAPERIFDPRTKYILVDDFRSRPQWLLDGLARYYSVETVIMGTEVYRRVAP